jgi:hypothetical protein
VVNSRKRLAALNTEAFSATAVRKLAAVKFYFNFFGFFKLFFSSLFKRLSILLISSSGGKFSGLMPREIKVSLTDLF